jgi:hypothetical protein
MNPVRDASGIKAVTRPLSLVGITPELPAIAQTTADKKHEHAKQDEVKIRHGMYSPPNYV